MTTVVGEIGGRLDILVRVGTTVGPFLLKFQQPDGTYADFTGYTFAARARTRTSPAVNIALVATLADPTAFPGADWTAGRAILLSATAAESAKLEQPATMSAPPKIADWEIDGTAGDGSVNPLLYGEIRSYLRLP